MEARTAFRAPEPDARPEAVAVEEPDAQQAAVVVAAPGAPQAAGAVPDAQREAVALDAAVAAVSDAQREAEASGAQQAVGPMAVARPLVASVEPAETAAVRLWFRATMVSAAALEPALVSAAKVRAAADR